MYSHNACRECDSLALPDSPQFRTNIMYRTLSRGDIEEASIACLFKEEHLEAED